jgi:hypothetical protein
VLGGDLRQILPVVEGGDRAQVVNAAIVNSSLWKQVHVHFYIYQFYCFFQKLVCPLSTSYVA